MARGRAKVKAAVTKSTTWMPFYVGDYLSDTMHLTTLEHGAYVLLIIHYWRTGPLPDDDRELATIARMEPRAWKGIATKLRRFFRPLDGELHHKRIDHELANAAANVEQRRAAGLASAEARKRQREANEKPTGVDTSEPTSVPTVVGDKDQREGKPSPSPSQSSLRSDSSRANVRQIEDDFERRFWPLYPRKDDKGHARQAFVKACKKADPDEIIRGLSKYQFSADRQYQPLAATWLNGERWLSEAKPPPLLETAQPNWNNF